MIDRVAVVDFLDALCDALAKMVADRMAVITGEETYMSETVLLAKFLDASHSPHSALALGRSLRREAPMK